MSVMDIRLVVGFCDHPKTVKLQRKAGPEAVICLLRLWLWARVNRPDGDLSGLDDDDIEIAAGWTGEPGAFVEAARTVGFLDGSVLHDWEEHQGWACGQKRRSNAARKAALARWHKREDADAQQTECGRNADASQPTCGRNAPSPSPNPNPSPKASTSLRSVDACAELSQARPAAPSSSDCRPARSTDPPMKAPPVIMLPTNKRDVEYPVTEEQVAEWAELYPAVDVMQELRKMRGWLLANKRKRKTFDGMPKFINAWLAKEQDRGGVSARASPATPPRSNGRGLAAAVSRFGAKIRQEVHDDDKAGDGDRGESVRALPRNRRNG